MSITFYDCQMAPSPRRVRIVLAEKNISHDAVEIDLMTVEQLGEDYKKINPDCTVPAIQLDDGTMLTNVAGINAWAEATHPEPALGGTTPLEKAEIATWLSIAEQELGMAIPNALRNTNPAFKGRALPGAENFEQIPALAERGLQQIDGFMAKLENRLQGRDYIAANQFSFADIAVICFIGFIRVVGKKVTDEFPNIQRWHAAMNKRPSV